jgi:transposase
LVRPKKAATGREFQAASETRRVMQHKQPPGVLKWVAKHPHFVLHFIPTSASWLNAVEDFFANLAKKRLKRGVSSPCRDSKMPSILPRRN